MKATVFGYLILFLAGLSAAAGGAADDRQVIRLQDGTTLTFLGITHGKRHFAPGYEGLTTANWIHTPKPTAVAWVEAEHDPKVWPNFELLISDPAKTGCVNVERKNSSRARSGLDIFGFLLNAYPRWEKEMIVRVRPFHRSIAEGQFVFTNSVQARLADWKADPLPATKWDGDLAVTLTSFVAGAPAPRHPHEPKSNNDPANECVRLDFDIQQNGEPVSNWRARLVRTWDPAGNFVEGVMSGYPKTGIYDYPRQGHPGNLETDGYFYRPGLWTAAVPWKFRMELTRKSGFHEDEIVTLTNLQVRAGTEQEYADQWTWDESKNKFPFKAATVHGVQLKVLPPLLLPGISSSSGKRLSVVIHHDADPALPRMYLTLLEATDENGQKIHTPFSPVSSSHFSLDFPNAKDVRALNLKLAFQKRRYVEFTVDPAVQQ